VGYKYHKHSNKEDYTKSWELLKYTYSFLCENKYGKIILDNDEIYSLGRYGFGVSMYPDDGIYLRSIDFNHI